MASIPRRRSVSFSPTQSYTPYAAAPVSYAYGGNSGVLPIPKTRKYRGTPSPTFYQPLGHYNHVGVVGMYSNPVSSSVPVIPQRPPSSPRNHRKPASPVYQPVQAYKPLGCYSPVGCYAPVGANNGVVPIPSSYNGSALQLPVIPRGF